MAPKPLGVRTVELATPEWVDWYTTGACTAPAAVPPAEYEQVHYRFVAGLTEGIPAQPSLH